MNEARIRSRPEVGTELPLAPMRLTFERICQVTAISGDWYRGHYSPDFAAEQGQPTIFASTLYLHGLVDKYVTDIFGRETFVFRRRMRMVHSVYAGFDGEIAGRVVSHDPETNRWTVHVELRDDAVRVWAEVVCGDH